MSLLALSSSQPPIPFSISFRRMLLSSRMPRMDRHACVGQYTTCQLYVGGERESQRLVQRCRPRELDRAGGTTDVMVEGRAGARQDAALEAELGRLAHARLDARDGAQLAAQADLADQGGVGRDSLLAEAGGDGRRHAEVYRRLAEG